MPLLTICKWRNSICFLKILSFFCLVAFGHDFYEHRESHEAERREICTHASVGRPIPNADEPVTNQHKVREEEQEACGCDGCGRFIFVTNEVADCFSKHGSNNQGINKTNDAEDGNVKRHQGREKEDDASNENGSADRAIKRFDFLNETVCDDEEYVTECEYSCTGDKLPVDENVTEKREEKTCHHGNIEFHVGLFRFVSVNKIDCTKDGKERTASTFQHAHEIKVLVKKVGKTNCGNHDEIDCQHNFWGFFHCSPRK